MPLMEATFLSGSLTPVVRYFYPLPDTIPSGASYGEHALDDALIFTFKGPPLDVFFGSPHVTQPLLQRVQEGLEDRLEGHWGLQVTFYEHDGSRPSARKVGLQASPVLQKFKAKDAENLADATKHCVDLQFGYCQVDAYLTRLQRAESSMDGRLGFADLVDYEISKNFDQARPAIVISQILKIHHHRTMTTSGDERFDNMLAGYQTTGMLHETDEFSAETLAMADQLRELAASNEAVLKPLLARKKSERRFHLLSVEEGIAELHAFVACKYVADGNVVHHTLKLPLAAKEQFLCRYYPALQPQSDPHSRGLKLFRDILEKHGYTFCHLAAWLCKMNFQKMSNLLPLYVLKQARDTSFPCQPNRLLNHLSCFEFEHVNACAKIAPAITYLGLDGSSAEEIALQLLL